MLRFTLAVLAALLLAMSGCDDPPGAPEVDPTPPRIENLQYAPQEVIVSDTADTVPVDLVMLADALPGDAPIERVSFSILASGANIGAVGELPALPEDNQYGINARIDLPADFDQYTVRVFATATDSLQSNVTLGQFRIVPDTTTAS